MTIATLVYLGSHSDASSYALIKYISAIIKHKRNCAFCVLISLKACDEHDRCQKSSEILRRRATDLSPVSRAINKYVTRSIVHFYGHMQKPST
jgi:hypothetical protein